MEYWCDEINVGILKELVGGKNKVFLTEKNKESNSVCSYKLQTAI